MLVRDGVYAPAGFRKGRGEGAAACPSEEVRSSDTLLLVDCRRAAHQYAPAAAFIRPAHCLVYHRRRRQKERTGDSSLGYFLRRRVSHLRSATSCIDPERGACSCCSCRPTGKPLATSPQLLFPLRRPPAACRRRRPSVPSSAMRTYGAAPRQETTMRGGGTRRLTAVISGRRHRGRCHGLGCKAKCSAWARYPTQQ